MDVLAKRLKKCRENIKKSKPEYTQSFVANKIGVARTTYTAYENGTKMPPIDTLSNIAQLFEVTTDYLLGISDNPEPTIKDDKAIYDRFADDFLMFSSLSRDEKIKNIIKNASELDDDYLIIFIQLLDSLIEKQGKSNSEK